MAANDWFCMLTAGGEAIEALQRRLGAAFGSTWVSL